MGCAPQFRAPAPPEVSGPLDPAAKPNPRARPSPNEPLPRMRLPQARRIPTAIHVNHPPGPERAADPGRLGANRRPRPEPVAGSPPPDTKLRLTPRRESREATYRPPPSSAHPRLRRRRRSFRAIWSAAARSWRTSDDAERAQAPASPVKASARTASCGRRRANASESRCPPQVPPRDVDLWHKTLTFMVFGEMSPNNSNRTPP